MPTRLQHTTYVLFLVLVCALKPLLAYAQSVPPLINYQGQISNPDGTPLPTADYELTFRIYDAPQGGTVVWGPQTFSGASGPGYGPKIPVVQGYFNVMLGPTDANGKSLADAFTAGVRFLEIAVGARLPISPRQRLLSAPFALNSGNSDKLNGYDWSPLFGINDPVSGRISGTKLVAESVGSMQLAAGAVTPEELAPNSVGTEAILNNSVVSAKLDAGAVTAEKIGVAAIDPRHFSSLTKESAMIPPGTIMAFAGPIPPAGWLLCDGTPCLRAAYPSLFSAIGTGWGSDNSQNFRLPDLRGVFLRGVNGLRSDANYSDPDATSRDNLHPGGNPGNQVGSFQRDAFANHTHAQNVLVGPRNALGGPGAVGDGNPSGDYGRLNATQSSGGTETRPKNAYVNYLVKY